MINCVRNNVELSGTALTLLGEFGMIAHSLRKTLLRECDNKFEAETVRKMMDAAYNFREEGKTC